MLAGLTALAMAGFAREGGDYGTHHVLALRRQVRDETTRIAQLRREVDSLARIEHALKTDSATQERAAREVYGMIRPGEMLYQVVPRDTATHR